MNKLLKILLITAAVLAAFAGFAYWALPKTRDINGSRVFSASQVEG